MATIRNRLFPFRDVSDHNKISLYSMNVVGDAGQLVKIVTGTANPQSNKVDGYTSTNLGTSYNGTYSKRYKNNWEIMPTASGDTKFNSLGITLLSTKETDENDMPLKYFPERAKQIGAVTSGETVPVATKGLFGLWGKYIDQSLGAVQPGNLVVISRSGDGTLGAVSPDGTSFRAGVGATPGATGATAAWTYDTRHVVGKWLSSLPTSTNTGVANEFSDQGGYAFFTLNVQA